MGADATEKNLTFCTKLPDGPAVKLRNKFVPTVPTPSLLVEVAVVVILPVPILGVSPNIGDVFCAIIFYMLNLCIYIYHIILFGYAINNPKTVDFATAVKSLVIAEYDAVPSNEPVIPASAIKLPAIVVFAFILSV